MKYVCRILFAVLLVVGSTISAQAAKRVALVIGNSAYENVSALANPKNDADDVTVSLEKVGFEVTKIKDAGYQEMRLALREFGAKSQGSEIALIYYAGHGIEVNKRNYLIPTDAVLKTDIDVEFETLPLETISLAVSGAKNLRLILLDACRNNPFARSMTRTISSRSIGRGLARIEPTVGTLVSYAAKEGTVAADGTGNRNSPYTRAFIEHLDEAGLEVQFMFRKIRDSVLTSTNGKQEPFTYGSLPGKRIFLNPAAEKPITKAVIQKPKPKPDITAEVAFWDSIKNGKNSGYYQAYLNRYPKGVFSELARMKMDEINIADNQAKSGVAKAQQQEIEKAAASKEATAAKQSEVRIAAIDPANIQEQTNPNLLTIPDPKNDRELVRSIQRELNRLGCNAGKVDGHWGNGSAGALRIYRKNSKARLASLDPSNDLLSRLKSKISRVCPLVCKRGFEVTDGQCVRIKRKTETLKKSEPNRRRTSAKSQNNDKKSRQQRTTSIQKTEKASTSIKNQRQCGLCRISSQQSATFHTLCGKQFINAKGRGWCSSSAKIRSKSPTTKSIDNRSKIASKAGSKWCYQCSSSPAEPAHIQCHSSYKQKRYRLGGHASATCRLLK